MSPIVLNLFLLLSNSKFINPILSLTDDNRVAVLKKIPTLKSVDGLLVSGEIFKFFITKNC